MTRLSRCGSCKSSLALLAAEWLRVLLLGAHHRGCLLSLDSVLCFDGSSELCGSLLELLLGGGHWVGVRSLVAWAGFGSKGSDPCLVLNLDVNGGT